MVATSNFNGWFCATAITVSDSRHRRSAIFVTATSSLSQLQLSVGSGSKSRPVGPSTVDWHKVRIAPRKFKGEAIPAQEAGLIYNRPITEK
jgi:hypothetical protein